MHIFTDTGLFFPLDTVENDALTAHRFTGAEASPRWRDFELSRGTVRIEHFRENVWICAAGRRWI